MKILHFLFSRYRLMRKTLLLLLLFPAFLVAQEIYNPVDSLPSVGRKILAHPEYAMREAANELFLETLKNYLATDAGFDDPLAEVTNMLRLELGKDARLYTWQMPDSAFRYTRFGLLAAKAKDGIVVTELKDQGESNAEAQFRQLKPEDWYGAIYYKAIPVKKGNDRLYTLLGFAPGSEINQKIIDVVEIDRRGRPRFGARIFKVDEFMDRTLRKAPMRLILSYNADYAASVRWNEDEEMIVMDHLAPPDAKLKGVYQMYGPDMTYDGLVWDDGWWNLTKEVKFNSRQNVPIVPPDKPIDLPRK